jgi:hypothetical protein
MDFTKDGKLKVGNTTLSSLVKITVPDYDWELPEIHSSSPITIPMYNSVSSIINWLERGINIDFCNKEDADKVFFFVLEYNRFAEKENKKIDNIDDQYKLVYKAQEKLFRMIGYKNCVEKRKADDEIPFKHNLYKGIKREGNEQVSTSYKNPFMTKNNKTFTNKGKKETAPFQDGIFAYDIFGANPDISIAEANMYKDIELS